MAENRIKEQRKKQGFLQQEVAEKAGISVMSYQRYESGKRVPDAIHAILIDQALNSSVEELFGSTQPERGL